MQTQAEWCLSGADPVYRHSGEGGNPWTSMTQQDVKDAGFPLSREWPTPSRCHSMRKPIITATRGVGRSDHCCPLATCLHSGAEHGEEAHYPVIPGPRGAMNPGFGFSGWEYPGWSALPAKSQNGSVRAVRRPSFGPSAAPMFAFGLLPAAPKLLAGPRMTLRLARSGGEAGSSSEAET